MQDYASDQYEIIIVDNGSTDGTVQIVEEFSVTIIKNVQGNVSNLRNVGTRSSKGDILAFIDSDCIAPLTWLSDAIHVLETKNVSVVGSWYALPDDPTWVQRVWDLQMSGKRKEGFSEWVPSGNFIVRKNAFYDVGGFEEKLQTGEDTNICQKLSDKGHKIYCIPILAVKHLGEAAKIIQFFKKQQWHGIGGVQRFVREFPKRLVDKTMIFSAILLYSVLGIGFSLMFNFVDMALGCVILGLLIPAVMTLKAMLRTKQWKFFFPLIALYFIYGFARMISLLNVSLWSFEIKQRIKI